MYSGVIFFFTSAPSYDGVMYAINLKCLKSVCCFDVINLGMVPEELVKTKKVVSSINISKWSAGSGSCEIKVLSSAESSVLWDRFCEGLV